MSIKKNRKTGFYWVHIKDRWVVAEYDGTYWLKKINCKSSGSGCSYEVLGSEITKTPQIFEQQKTLSD